MEVMHGDPGKVGSGPGGGQVAAEGVEYAVRRSVPGRTPLSADSSVSEPMTRATISIIANVEKSRVSDTSKVL